MKLVINSCYGGFSLSARAIQRLAELNGQKCYFFRTELQERKTRYIPTTLEEIEKDGDRIRSMFFTAYNTPTPPSDGNEDWNKMTAKERQESNDRYRAASLDSRPENRADPKLVQVVEELGEKANGSCAKLKIVEIPDGIKWQLSEYDGIESVEEEHRSWN